MARSDYIYVVVDVAKPVGPPVKTFTVKYEMVRWLTVQTASRRTWLEVYRCRDGTLIDRPPSKMDLSNI